MSTITKRGDKYFAQVRIKKQGAVVFSESRSFDTKPQAKSWADKLEAKIKAEGTAAAAVRELKLGKLIMDQLAYLNRVKKPGRSVQHTYGYMAFEFADLPVKAMTAKHFVDFAIKRKNGGAKPATILADLSAVSATLNAAPFSLGIEVDSAPITRAIAYLKDQGIVGRSDKVNRLASDQEIAALLEEAAARSDKSQTTIDMVLVIKLALAFPRRASELTRLKWADIDTARKSIWIRDVKHPTAKEGNDQLVPLVGDSWKLIQDAPRVSERILPWKSESMCSAFERMRDRISVTGMPEISTLRFHDLRHTGITRLFAMGLDIPQVAAISGHSNWAQLTRYTHVTPEDVHAKFGKT